jgi:cytochrome c oxidase subunit 1
VTEAQLAMPDAVTTPGLWRRYVFSTDHKMIGRQYMLLSLLMAVLGGATAYVMRWQLAWPQSAVPLTGWLPESLAYHGVIDPAFYNQLVTMHGTIMIFFVGMPMLLGGLGNFLVPLMIGAPDMAFPRLNMLSFWIFFTASLLLLSSFFVPAGAASAGWTMYPPLSARAIYTGVEWGINLWLIAVALEFVSFLLGGINLVVTTINMRAPGLSFMRLPLMVWMELTAAGLFLLSVGPLLAGVLLLLLDRIAGTSFFVPNDGDPLLWQHLFWFFGHPEVYVLLLPGVGAVLEILPVFARKPIFAYRAIVWSTAATGVLSFMVWAHHMFVSGMDPRLATPFSITTILISVPLAVVLFAMIATLWRGSIRFATPMLWALGFLATFLIGGLTGIFVGAAALDIYFHGTYFVVAHFHYALFPSVFFGGFAAIYFWYPKMFGRMLSERLGQLHFGLTVLAFNAVFLPMFLLGFGGHMRRIYDPTVYEFLRPLMPLHVVATVATVVLLLSQLPFVLNVIISRRRGRVAGANPWRAATLEWSAPSPPPHGNFDILPAVFRGPYEYSVPGAAADVLPQDQPSRAPRSASAS